VTFGLPEMIGGQMRSVVPWSRILSTQELVLAINTDYDQSRSAWVTIDNNLHQTGDQTALPLLHRCDTNWSGDYGRSPEWKGSIDRCSISWICDVSVGKQ
jgi:hypothetical protein